MVYLQFLIDNDVLSHELWWFNGFDQFEVIFETLLRMNILAEVDEQTHDLFVKAGQKFLLFLQERAQLQQEPEPPRTIYKKNNHLPSRKYYVADKRYKVLKTSHKINAFSRAFVDVLVRSGRPMTAKEILSQITADEQYSFLEGLSNEDLNNYVKNIEANPVLLKQKN